MKIEQRRHQGTGLQIIRSFCIDLGVTSYYSNRRGRCIIVNKTLRKGIGMKRFKKTILYIMCPLLALSICLNIYFVVHMNSNNIVVEIDGKSVLTETALISYLKEKYETMVINEAVGNYLLQLEAHARGITDPNDEQLQELTEDYASFSGYKNIEDYRDELTSAYFVKEIFVDGGVDDNTLRSFLDEYYGDENASIYQLKLYETHDHSLATRVQELLEAGKSINEVETQMKIEFLTTYTASIENILSAGEDVQGAAISDMHTATIVDTESNAPNESNSVIYHVGDVFHVMDETGMEIIQISDILNLENDREIFVNLYFSKKYTFIRNNIVNNLKGKYVITYK